MGMLKKQLHEALEPDRAVSSAESCKGFPYTIRGSGDRAVGAVGAQLRRQPPQLCNTRSGSRPPRTVARG